MTRLLKSSVHLTFRIGSQDGVQALVPGAPHHFRTWTLHLQISAAAALSPSSRAPLGFLGGDAILTRHPHPRVRGPGGNGVHSGKPYGLPGRINSVSAVDAAGSNGPKPSFIQ